MPPVAPPPVGALPGRVVLLGRPVAHSLSPVFQNAALVAAGLPLRYEALEVADEDLARVLAQLKSERAAGNVTVPHKERIAALCDRLTPLAAAVGAVNTFWVDPDGALVGDNTDVGGFDAAVRRLLERDPAGLRVALLGAGGAAAAVAASVRSWPGASLVVHARSRERAERLAERFPGLIRIVDGEMDALAAAELLVNATPLGLEGSLMPIAPGMIPKSVAVLDLTYRRGRTPWIQGCRSRGLRADDGLPMLIEQGALAFERWFKLAPDREVMWAAVRS